MLESVILLDDTFANVLSACNPFVIGTESLLLITSLSLTSLLAQTKPTQLDMPVVKGELMCNLMVD